MEKGLQSLPSKSIMKKNRETIKGRMPENKIVLGGDVQETIAALKEVDILIGVPEAEDAKIRLAGLQGSNNRSD